LICRVIQRDIKQYPERIVRELIDLELEPGIIDYPASSEKTAAENAVKAFVQLLPISNHVATIVRLIGHHDNHCVAAHAFEPADDGAAKSVFTRV
jgi:hypothetical protein